MTSFVGRSQRFRDLVFLVAALVVASSSHSIAQRGADTAVDIGSVRASAPPARLDATPAPGTAADVAPSRAPLSASQPTSVVGPTFIQENITPTDNYDRIILFTPSVQNVEPVGAGLQQNYQETIRGFQYTQFNTTFDGIVLPGLPTNFAPESQAYFLSHDIRSVEVDRGPGTASTIGYATFGGTVAIKSTSPSDVLRVSPYATFGSWGTKLYGTQVDSGSVAAANGARGFIDLEREEGRGALSGTSTARDNAFAKLEAPVGDNSLLTFVGLYDDDYVHTPYGATLAQIQQFGPKYALNGDTRSQAFTGYNYDHYFTDFEYLGLQSRIGDGWSIDDKVYTNGYFQRGSTGQDPNGTTPNLTSSATRRFYVNGALVTLNNDVPGYQKHNDFRDYGNVLKVTKDTALGQLRTGLWLDYTVASNYRYQVLLNRGLIPYSSGSPTATPFIRNYNTDLYTVQPYLEWALTPLPGLVVTPGLKFTSTTRDLDALVNSGTKLPAQFSETYSQLQPAVDARYTIKDGWVVYAQTARGFLAPPINVLYTAQPQALAPQDTWNYQVGSTYQTDDFTVSGDGYYIDFGNRIGSRPLAGGDTLYFNSGGATYKGLEFEGTVRVGYGASLYGNYSINSAELRGNGGPLSVTPRNTAALGVIYHRDRVWRDGDRLYGSIIGKFIGPQYLQDTPASIPIPGYSFADLAVGYRLPVWNGRTLDLRVNLNNLTNDRSLIGLAAVSGSSARPVPLYWTDAGRSVFFSLAVTL